MKLLVLGGGGFLGYHVVAEALQAGHEVSAFKREGEAPLDGVEALQGDRQDDLTALRGVARTTSSTVSGLAAVIFEPVGYVFGVHLSQDYAHGKVL